MADIAEKRSQKLHVIILLVLLAFIALSLIKWPAAEYLDLTEYLPRYPLSQYPPRTIMYSSISLSYLKETAAFWHRETGMRGFIINTLRSNWYDDPRQLWAQERSARETNIECRKYGIDANFVKISFGLRTLPDYFDDTAWQKILLNCGEVARFAKKTGFIGIALDTESYTKVLWNSSKGTLARHPKDLLKAKIRQRGKEVMQAIIAAYPDAEIFLIPEGYLLSYETPGPSKYELWIDFVNGMLSVRNRNGIVLGCEAMYKLTNKNKLLDFYYREVPMFVDALEDPQFWIERCSIALGAWPLGREYDDKSGWYGPKTFGRQLRTMEMVCPRYVWIYAHGSSWWQEKDLKKYAMHPESALPTVKNIREYYAVVKESSDPLLKRYFYAVKYNKYPSILDIIREKATSW